MEDFGNIVYVIAAIGWFLWKTFKKSDDGAKKPASKPRRSSMPEEPRQSPVQTLEEMILEQLGERPKPQVQTRSRSTETSNKEKFLSTDLTHSHLPNDYQMSVTEMKSHWVERQVEPLRTEDEEHESLFDQLLPNGFDLRQAVVLETILQRPYK